MKQTTPRFTCFLFVLFLLFGRGTFGEADRATVLAATDASETFEQIKRDWAKRRKRTRTVTYRLRGTATYLPGSLVSPDDPGLKGQIDTPAPNGIPPTESSYDMHSEWALDFENSLFRKESYDMSFNLGKMAFRPYVRIDVFDGEGLKTLFPREENTSPIYTPHPDSEDVVFERDVDTGWFFSASDLPVLFAHGLVGLNLRNVGGFSAERLPNWQVKGSAIIDGVPCTQVVSAEVFERASTVIEVRRVFYVDTQRDSAILCWEKWYNDELNRRVDVKYRETEDGWLPQSWTAGFYRIGNDRIVRIYATYRLTVENVTVNEELDRSLFHIELKPGMNVLRKTDWKRFRVAQDGTLLERTRNGRLIESEAATPFLVRQVLIVTTCVLFVLAFFRWRAVRQSIGFSKAKERES